MSAPPAMESPRHLAPIVARRSLWLSLAAIALAALAVLGLAMRRGEAPTHPTSAGEPLAALVNGIPVTMASYQRQLRFATNGYSGPRAPAGSPAASTLHRLLVDQAVGMAIAEALIDYQAAKAHIAPSDAEIAAEVRAMTVAAGGAPAFAAQMRAAGMSVDDVRWVARHTVERNRLGTALRDPAWLDHRVAKATITYYVGDGAAGHDDVPAVSFGHPAPPFLAVDLK